MTENTFLTLKHYKEPLIKVKKGFGYYGAISITTDGKYIQCHICGKLFESLQMHLVSGHKTSAREYRETYKLSATTALVSECEREKRKERTLQWLATLSEEEKQTFREEGKKGWLARKRNQPNESLESKNIKGTCPDQLLDVIRKVKKEIGHTPSLAEFIVVTGGQRYKHLIFKTYGSWKNALKILNYEVKSSTPNSKRQVKTDEELLESLTIFSQENRTIPTDTDSKRGLIPDSKIYQRRFGSLEKARILAGVYDFVERV